MKASLKDNTASFSFVLPALLIFLVFYVYPFFYSFVLSLTDYSLIGKFNFKNSFVGLQNFKDLLVDIDWWKSFYNAGFITFFALTFQNILALLLALAVDKVIRMRKFYRVVFFILPVLSEIIIGLLMKQFMLSEPTGRDVLNNILNNIGLGFMAQDWIAGHNVRLITALVHCWKGFGWAFVILLAGLQSIPDQLYEAARIDGANTWQQFCKITMPLLMPVSTLVMVLTILGTMQAFAMILALNQGAGGETTVPVMIIYNHLGTGQAGLACAEGLILGAILVVVSFTMFYVSKIIREKYGVVPN
ncbi:MAG: sugar ABC transporter permease [Candidatus Omnitrophica bacterium]|nr:sugar ABC transporter permease [Candidatus Omnitrophota bacterium]MDD5081306.1 sugar ABC transporter permease [Candidatus Omnitrophota bacterium]MDD5440786.1 sugar ABC transporter permease [Candidatus Omnitrophota bacterium]